MVDGPQINKSGTLSIYICTLHSLQCTQGSLKPVMRPIFLISNYKTYSLTKFDLLWVRIILGSEAKCAFKMFNVDWFLLEFVHMFKYNEYLFFHKLL